MKKLVSGILSFGLLLPLSACQQKVSQEEMDKHIESYLERKGEKWLEEASQNIVRRKRQEHQENEQPKFDQKKKRLIEGAYVDDLPVKGESDAPVTIVEFVSLQCFFSARLRENLNLLMKQYPDLIRIAWRHNPLSIHPNAIEAAKAAEAARLQDKFWPMTDLLFDNQQQLTQENFIKWAKQLELDIKKFKSDMKSKKVLERIERDRDFALKHDLRSTPVTVFNGVPYTGKMKQFRYQAIMDILLEELGQEVPYLIQY